MRQKEINVRFHATRRIVGAVPKEGGKTAHSGCTFQANWESRMEGKERNGRNWCSIALSIATPLQPAAEQHFDGIYLAGVIKTLVPNKPV
jgi:hypothetical protein